MKNQPHPKKLLIGVIVGIIVLLLAYFYLSGGSAPADSGTLTRQNQSENSAVVGTHILSLLNQIKSLRIDTSIFKDPAYKTLTDYSVAIPEVNVGRPNPFAPL